ncbi:MULTISPECIES: hypothetical protein [Cytobacillus]|uniref:hypothetical protein n=1 Tax=Cytobacillus TaxID=2675230 RepID=UPI0025A28332|nr:hypothetical protein [Cytobacillus kochii]MDM5208429.1 hypothetical protein [Cytobacillus kochii]
MHVFIRKTAQGNEYWDAKEKKIVFVPVGVKPSFEVTENPKSMIVGVDLAKEKDLTAVHSLDSMNVPQLKKYAADNNIEIPPDAKKKEDILKVLNEVL